MKAAIRFQQMQKEGVDKNEEAYVQEGMQTFFRLGKLEIEGILRRVCEEVLRDEKVAKPILKKRAEALRTLGRLYKAAK